MDNVKSVSFVDRVGSRFNVLYSLLLFRALHLLLTIVAWQHFFQNKYYVQLANVPEGAPNYWLKRLMPPFEFGLMHAILFQLALLPLTMAKRLLALLSTEVLGSTFPFQHIMQFHIQVGYAFCILLIGATIGFFGFFGKICYDFRHGLDPADFCSKLRSEIFVTGLVTAVSTAIVLITSFIRGRVPYELFKIAHGFVFVMFLVAAVHTFDKPVREGTLRRSQTLSWFGASMTLYLTDRAWCFFTTHRCRVLEAVSTGKVLLLRVERPAAFRFCAGQYAQICVPGIDPFWHPFSIGSGNEANYLCFLIEVKPGQSWTGRLASDACIAKLLSGEAALQVRGPYGYAVADLARADAVLGVGTGTGVVPMLSLMQERARAMSLVGKAALAKAKLDRMAATTIAEVDVPAPRQARFSGADDARAAAATKIQHAVRRANLADESAFMRALFRRGTHTSLHAVFDIVSWLLILGEVTSLGLAFSWSTLSEAARAEWQGRALEVAAAVLLAGYSLHFVYRYAFPTRFLRSLWAWLDGLFTMGSIALLAVWWSESTGNFGSPTALQLLLRTLLAAWRVWRLLQASPLLRASWHRQARSPNSLGAEQYKMIWVCRDAGLAAGYIPRVNRLVDELHRSLYGKPATASEWKDRLGHFIDFTIYVTDTDDDSGTLAEGSIVYERPDLFDVILKEKQRQIVNYGLGAKGSPAFTYNAVGRICQEAAFASNQLATLLSCPQFVTTFREEYYGFAPPVVRKSGVAAVTPSSLDASPTSRARSRAEQSKNLARLKAAWGGSHTAEPQPRT
ncbi:hypothetical protein EMIHUDRAFT_469863 [Emiliania huxleyi CCMP1516]|uniref:FAD-binding FR-type domain-containing protein n=2 Tax=Emiliania huxleyi TaxID=2903 RepID=A0A0D3JCC3_EMIH1|nr:hypothetical protein EMIHUDRAFT_469863 [Emiliania huxleyi CCMP1516]EOD21158.1 hypothetical protein EMIHUDRAFT_469863 [Emiliania huxleyi CCMP1516]|eukprot:XP_005773587.1 hypothetical protein EMIHUDRAFT_469863 [Emiliania huxleyi CCMP1516]